MMINRTTTLRDQTPRRRGAPRFLLTQKQILAAVGTDDASLQNRMLIQALSGVWPHNGQNQDQAIMSMLAALEAIGPAAALQGMLATKMVAAHGAAIECLRRAMLSEQTFAGRHINPNRGENLLQIYARQMEALDKHRCRGQQKITIGHVNVHAGNQADLGNVEVPVPRTRTASEAQGTLGDQSAAVVELPRLTDDSNGHAKQTARQREQ